MTTRIYLAPPGGGSVEIPDSVTVDGWSVQHKAEEGAVGTGQVTFSDPLGELSIGGHRVLTIVEDAIEDPDDQIIFRGFTADRGILRGKSERQGAGRIWQANVVDANSIIARRVMRGGGNKRPAEKDTARVVTWLMNTTEAALMADQRFLFTDHPTSMDPVDYEGQMLSNIIADCAEATGKNYWADWFGPLSSSGDFGMWYGHPGLPDYIAGLSISNDLAEIDNESVFAMSEDTKMVPDPSRVFSGVDVQYDGGHWYGQLDSTASNYARRDTIMSAPNVKTAAKAAKRGKRWLADLATEDVRITTTIWLPPTHVNFAKAGMLIPFQATHFPGYETYQLLRILSRTISAPGLHADFGWVYKIDLELSGGDLLPAEATGSARLYFPNNKRSGDEPYDIVPDVAFNTTGDDPGPGRIPVPISDPFEYVLLTGGYTTAWEGIQVNDDIDVDIRFRTGIIAVVNGDAVATWQILVDGSVVAEDTMSSSGGLRGWAPGLTLTASSVSVTSGQVITCKCWVDDGSVHGKVPNGTGFPDQYLEVTAS